MITALRKAKRMASKLIERDRPIILMYHRVAWRTHDPWQLAVSPDRFADQIAVLVQLRQVVPLRWLADQITQRRLPKKVAVVTFDDGYVDLLGEAKPVLERYTCPATAFLVTGAIGTMHSFWWDELAHIVFETPVLPTELEIEIARRPYRWWIDERPTPRTDPAYGHVTVTREELHNQLWRLLRPLQPEPRWEQLERLCAWAGTQIEEYSAHRALTADEVRCFASPGFIDIGAHSVTHPALPMLDETSQRAEIGISRVVCEELIGEPIHTFAYPHGEFDDATIACVRAAGFACACTTRTGRMSAKCDPMLLPRFPVGNWDGAVFARKLAWGL
jgi:peptidoglycan/xylan/chitin deacetylase (PgdA/CDA1 family)